MNWRLAKVHWYRGPIIGRWIGWTYSSPDMFKLWIWRLYFFFLDEAGSITKTLELRRSRK
jgi:hypothetical protein